MKISSKSIFTLIVAMMTTVGAMATEYSYVWSTEFPNYQSQTPSSDFTTADGAFRFTSERASGVSGPQFMADGSAGLLLRLYADNTLRIECLSGETITAVTFVIGGNGHYKLADLTPSSGQMGEPYIGKDATNTFREYRLFWTGNTADVTFTVGHECQYGIDCVDQGKEGEPGTCMTKQMLISTSASATTGIDQTNLQSPVSNVKFIKDGKLFIRQGDKTYNAQGARVE